MATKPRFPDAPEVLWRSALLVHLARPLHMPGGGIALLASTPGSTALARMGGSDIRAGCTDER